MSNKVKPNAKFPVSVPDSNGNPVITVGEATVSKNADRIVIYLKDSLGGELVKRMIRRGELMGFTLYKDEELVDDDSESS